MAIGICKLCKQETELIKKSHIIPDFIYRQSGMFDEKHRLITFDVQELKESGKIRRVQTGIYESNILCPKCDGAIIGGYEAYARQLIYGGLKPEHCADCVTVQGIEAELTTCTNINYAKYKLFILSILWRSHHAQDEFFNEINLEPQLEDDLRQMILHGDPGKYNDYPFVVGSFLKTGLSPDMIVTPHHNETDGNTDTYIMGGCSYLIFEGRNIQSPDVDLMALKEEGILKIFHFPQNEGRKYFFKFSGVKE